MKASLLVTFMYLAVCVAEANAQLGHLLNGRPITASDLSGKKICWDNGVWNVFAANGQFSNNRNPKPHGPEPGLVKTVNTYWQAEVLPDGQIYYHRFCGRCGSITGHSEHWGRVCN